MEAIPKIRRAGKNCGGRVDALLGRIFAKSRSFDFDEFVDTKNFRSGRYHQTIPMSYGI